MSSKTKVKVINLSKSLNLPKKESIGADAVDLMACFDYAGTDNPYSVVTWYDQNNKLTNERVYSNQEFVLGPFCRAKIPLGLKMEMELLNKFHVAPRSGLSLQYGIVSPGSLGKIDSDYRGQIYATVLNITNVPFKIAHGDRIAQGSLEHSLDFEWEEVEELSKTERGEGGFGHTGI